MKTSRRLAWHYGWQWLVVGAVLLCTVFAAFLWVADRMIALDLNRSFARHGPNQVSESLSMDQHGNVRWDDELQEQVRASGGWMQLIDEEGNVLTSFETPSDVPTHYSAGEVAAYAQGKSPFPYDLYIYIKQLDNRAVTLLYGVNPKDERLLETWLAAHSGDTGDGADALETMLEKHQAWVQRLNADGTEIASWNKPEDAPNRYSLQDIVMQTMYEERYGQRVAYRYDTASRETWLLHMPFSPSVPGVKAAGFTIESYDQLFVIAIAGTVAFMLFVFIMMAWWQSSRLARPLQHVMKWTESISSGHYEEPVNARGITHSERKNGKLKRNYRIYGDIMQSLQQMALRLKSADEERIRHETYREEWLAGLSHDLKTPLASIIGYAHLLSAKEYAWEPEEASEFVNIMKQKAETMDDLIQDLNLTYQLQSGSLPLQRELIDIRHWLTETLQDIFVLPQLSEAEFETFFPEQEVLFKIDTRYFRRMVDNVCMNAFLHNPPGTKLKVELMTEDNKLTLSFTDNGKGMDANTLKRLFTRYYRGTTTDETAKGSGLGLAITKQLVEAHGGSVEASSTLGGGTLIAFHFLLEVVQHELIDSQM
ncbi:HAMP domain-containing histidine kinase [Paenibacillus sp. MER TA 81-3]|uniref:sensor histidine kinase n=1 Tax=Paenibacillus sp. MER TA 81-3 TaxID=2939573 RepID=UPI00203D308F|nr:HAMP domain-containing sensor histidine kinase [Paenibacillus sp. MER TA 81-3]MCM3339632.1 HAMP domain-containing histidine kinase [Paenibacillus sp. MER TA 81-3]